MRIKIKPLSVNEAWQGRRYKTDKYKGFETELMLKLPPMRLDIEPPFEIHFKFGFSSPLADLDNPVKPVQDVLQKKYGFNDRDVYRMTVEKDIVPKGQEYIELSINQYKKATS